MIFAQLSFTMRKSKIIAFETFRACKLTQVVLRNFDSAKKYSNCIYI